LLWALLLQISVFARHAKDEIMLLASDGLWDVMSNQVRWASCGLQLVLGWLVVARCCAQVLGSVDW
jgi:hypothetical protein